MKNTMIILMALMLSAGAFPLYNVVGAASAGILEYEEDKWVTGKILEIDPKRRLIVVSDDRTSEELSFKVFESTLPKLSSGDIVRVYYSETVGILNMYKVDNDEDTTKVEG